VRANPTLSAADAFRQVAEKIEERKQVETQAESEALKAADGLSFTDEAEKTKWVKATARARAKARLSKSQAAPAATGDESGLDPAPKIVKPVVQHKGSTMTFTGKYSRDGKPIYTDEKGAKFTMEK
jgi:hypothetical protein